MTDAQLAHYIERSESLPPELDTMAIPAEVWREVLHDLQAARRTLEAVQHVRTCERPREEPAPEPAIPRLVRRIVIEHDLGEQSWCISECDPLRVEAVGLLQLALQAVMQERR